MRCRPALEKCKQPPRSWGSMTSGQRDKADSFHYSVRFSTAKRAATAALFPESTRRRLRPAQRQLPHALRVRRCVDQVRAALLARSDARRHTGRRLDLEVCDLEARQALRYVPAALAVVVTPKDAEVRGDVQLLPRVVADDVVHRQISGSDRRRESCGTGFHLQVCERAGAGGGPLD